MANPAQEDDAEQLRRDMKKAARLRRLFIAKISREGIVFLPLLFMVVTFIMLKGDQTALADVSHGIKQSLVDQYGADMDSPPLEKVTNAGMLYTWFEDVAIPKVLSSSTYDSSTGGYYVDDFNRVLGGIRFLQKRVKQSECTTDDLIVSSSSGPWDCYPELEGNEETSTWTALTESSWQQWRSCSELGGCLFSGGSDDIYSVSTELSYNPSGYVIDLGLDATAAASVVNTMRSNNWLDKQTRFVMLQFTVYNAALNVHTDCRFLFEQLAGGLYKSSSRITSVQLFHSWGGISDLVIILEFNIYAQALGTIIFHLYNLIRLGFVGWMRYNGVIGEGKAQKQTSTLIQEAPSQLLFELFDYVNLVIVVTSFVRRIVWMLNPDVLGYNLTTSLTTFQNHMSLVNFTETGNAIWGINVLIMILKCFKYLQAHQQ